MLNGGLRGLPTCSARRSSTSSRCIDAAVTRLDMSGFTETGGGAANLVVQGDKQTVYTVAPSLEIGTEWWWPNGTLVRPYPARRRHVLHGQRLRA